MNVEPNELVQLREAAVKARVRIRNVIHSANLSEWARKELALLRSDINDVDIISHGILTKAVDAE
jgi:hypothetical protein